MRDVNLRIKAYREEKQYDAKKVEYQSWLTGLFVRSAIVSAFNGKKFKYPDNPIGIEHKSMEEIAQETGKTKEELAQEEQYFSMRVRQANANIDKVRKNKESDSKNGADES